MEVSEQSEPGEEIAIGLLGLRLPEQELAEVLTALADLPADCQPYVLVRTQRNELQAIPEVIGVVEVDASQHRPVLVEPPG